MKWQYVEIALNKLQPPSKHLNSLVEFVWHNNHITYKDEIFKQIAGMGMGTNMAVNLADLYLLHNFELHPDINNTLDALTLYVRYVDDTFGIWTDGMPSFLEFVAKCQTLIPGINFTFETGTSLTFLDLVVSISPAQTIAVTCHQKELNKYLYLPFFSYHTPSSKRGFIKAELIRYARNCSHRQDFDTIRDRFRTRLLARGYPNRYIDQAFRSVNYNMRQDFIDHRPNSDSNGPLVLSTDHTSRTRRVRLRELLGRQEQRLQEIWTSHDNTPTPPPRILIAYRAARKLRTILCKPRHPAIVVTPQPHPND